MWIVLRYVPFEHYNFVKIEGVVDDPVQHLRYEYPNENLRRRLNEGKWIIDRVFYKWIELSKWTDTVSDRSKLGGCGIDGKALADLDDLGPEERASFIRESIKETRFVSKAKLHMTDWGMF